MKKVLYSVAPWLLLLLIALGVRYWYASAEVCFHTDQSRDAIVANRILQGDWQLFGPVANVQGALFHGVLYYYVIAPLYAVGGGSPWFVSVALSLLSVASLVPAYLLAKKILKSPPLAYVVAVLVALSATSIQTSASFWNLTLTIVLLPTYALLLWEMRSIFAPKYCVATGLLAGLLVQSGLSNVQWLLPLVVVVGWQYFKMKDTKKYLLNVGLIGGAFAAATSTMLAVEYLAWKRGLFGIGSTFHWASGDSASFENIYNVLMWVFDSLGTFLAPGYFSSIVAALFMLLTLCVMFFKRKTNSDESLIFLLLFLTPPIIGQLLSNGSASYLLSGYESILSIFVVLVVARTCSYFVRPLSRQKNIFIMCAVVVLFALSNGVEIQRQMQANSNITCMLQTNYVEKLQAIEYTYAQANGEDFSIDVVAEPYGINTTYGYLYSWYGNKKFGYTPRYIGVSQLGHPSEGLLEESQAYAPTHFILYEPGTYNYWFYRRTVDMPATPESQELFYYRQPQIEQLQESKDFGGSVSVDYYLSAP